jgi:hypothetical protein
VKRAGLLLLLAVACVGVQPIDTRYRAEFTADLPADRPPLRPGGPFAAAAAALTTRDPEAGLPQWPGYAAPFKLKISPSDLPPPSAFPYPLPYTTIIQLLEGWKQ